MPKKKKKVKLINNQDFTINDSANSVKAVSRVKKSTTVETTSEGSWEDIVAEDFDIVEEIGENGTKNFVYKKKKSKSETENDETGVFYPEIVWYLVSFYVKPEDVCQFALMNKTTYAITKRESFWRNLYKRYCDNNPKLPMKLRLENSYTSYGLRQRVIRALHYTYDTFVNKLKEQASQDSKPHELIKYKCINIWYEKPSYWSLYFKLKKSSLRNRIRNEIVSGDYLKELGRVDANPEEDCKVLQVLCKSGTFQNEVPPLMGMSLSVVTVVLGQGFGDHKIRLGFNSGSHNISRNILPENSIVIDKVLKILVYDWWHVSYPFDNRLPSNVKDDESLPMLKEDFFKMAVRD